jgi:pimeloyl-ACP methyl ester carboxylesterase
VGTTGRAHTGCLPDFQSSLTPLGPLLRSINASPKGDAKPLHASVLLISGAGHFIPQEKPGEFNQVLDGIVTALVTTAAKK